MTALAIYLYLFCCMQSYLLSHATTHGFTRTGFDLVWRIALAPVLIPLVIIVDLVKGR